MNCESSHHHAFFITLITLHNTQCDCGSHIELFSSTIGVVYVRFCSILITQKQGKNPQITHEQILKTAQQQKQHE